jgi:hypothetical protein
MPLSGEIRFSRPHLAEEIAEDALVLFSEDSNNVVVRDGLSINLNGRFSLKGSQRLSSAPTEMGFFVNGYGQAITVNVAHWASNLPTPI